MFNYAAAIIDDIGLNSIKIAVVKIHGEVIATKLYPLNSYQTRDYLISMLLRAIKDIRQSIAAEGINTICIGTAAKGFIDHASEIVIGPDQAKRFCQFT
jgi:predicted NBD/HSP70 family sugar kinase